MTTSLVSERIEHPPPVRNMAEESEMRVKVHSILEDYDVFWSQKLGCGVSGPVRPCTLRKTGQRFALKCLIDRPRARLELTMHLQCSGHPNIVSIHDVYLNEVQFPKEAEPRSRLLVVMELMDGGELFERISQQKYFTESQAAKYTKQIAHAIDRCHSLNIAHRDIKPENLLLKDNSEDAIVKLSDFGFAKTDDGNLMTPHFTPYYVAPQILEAQQRQAKDRQCILPRTTRYTYDKSCDMWSLGVLVYIMLSGYPPFYSETPSKLITGGMKRNIMAGQYEFLEEDWAHISVEAKDLVTNLLLVDTETRLTVNQVLSHPWLSQAPHTQLQSPAIMLDKNMLMEAHMAHSAQLTSMRLPDNQLTLKPIAQVNNPILRKRQQTRSMSTDTGAGKYEEEEEEPPSKLSTTNMATLTLRNLIAHCILPPQDGEVSASKLNELIRDAREHNASSDRLVHLLRELQWNGIQSPSDADLKLLAKALSELVQDSLQQESVQQPRS